MNWRPSSNYEITKDNQAVVAPQAADSPGKGRPCAPGFPADFDA
jgi:hypothetical protein